MVTNNFITGQELGEKLLASVQQMNEGLGKVVHSPVLAARQKSELSQTQFATLLGASVRTLQEHHCPRETLPTGHPKVPPRKGAGNFFLHLSPSFYAPNPRDTQQSTTRHPNNIKKIRKKG
jgi:hypothetical protein